LVMSGVSYRTRRIWEN